MEILAQNVGFCAKSDGLENQQELQLKDKTNVTKIDRLDQGDPNWDTLNFQYTPPKGKKRLQNWLVIHTQGSSDGQIRYLSLLQGELQATRVSFATNATPSFEEAPQVC